MTTNLDDLDPDSPEYEAAAQAAQEAEDAEREGTTPQGERPDDEASDDDKATEASADEAPASEADSEPEAKAEEAEPEAKAEPAAKALGVASKDGTRVLPYAALQAARRESSSERAARVAAEAERDALRQQIADLKAGKKPEAEQADAQLEEFVADFPAAAALVKEVRELRAKVTEKAAPVKADEQPEPGDDPVQSAIDTVPLLAAWQAEDAEKFERARAIDAALQGSPKWKGKPLTERFEHVARVVAGEFDIQIDEAVAAPQPNKRKDAKEVVQAAGRTAPNTLSDFKGSSADKTDAINRLPAAQLQSRMAEMTDAEIDAHLAKFG